MEQLLIFVVLALASGISSWLQNRRKKAEEAQEARGELGGERPVPPWQRSAGDWQENLKRMLEERMPPVYREQQPNPPPALPPVIRAGETKLEEKALELAQRVERQAERRLEPWQEQAAEQFRKSERLATRKKVVLLAPRRRTLSAEALARRWSRNPSALREAFVASVILEEPPGLKPDFGTKF